jgi:hypothetical protein
MNNKAKVDDKIDWISPGFGLRNRDGVKALCRAIQDRQAEPPHHAHAGADEARGDEGGREDQGRGRQGERPAGCQEGGQDRSRNLRRYR